MPVNPGLRLLHSKSGGATVIKEPPRRRAVALLWVMLGTLIVLAGCASGPITTPGRPSPTAAIGDYKSSGMGIASQARVRPTRFEYLPGWLNDDLRDFWPALITNCQVMRSRDSGWAQACKDTAAIDSANHASIREFIESRFTPHELSDAQGTRNGILTGYYEPLLRGSRSREGPYQFPIYRKPKDMVNIDLSSMYPETRGMRVRGKKEGDRIVPYPTRGEIERQQLLVGQELLWLDDPVENFFLHVQGSGRVLLPNGETIRVGYADQNGYNYRSIGRYLIDKGELKPNDASMQSIKAWIAMNPHRRDEVLHQNPSMVFFRELPSLAAQLGPIGSMGISLTPQRSIAVDPQFVMPGSLVFLNTRVPNPGAAPKDPGVPFSRLVIAQDTGSAITGPHRGDIFFGTGPQAGEVAGRMRSEGQMFVLLPK